jgi:hypothetical protein
MTGVIFSRSESMSGVRARQEGDYFKSESMSGVGVWRKLECPEGRVQYGESGSMG